MHYVSFYLFFIIPTQVIVLSILFKNILIEGLRIPIQVMTGFNFPSKIILIEKNYCIILLN